MFQLLFSRVSHIAHGVTRSIAQEASVRVQADDQGPEASTDVPSVFFPSQCKARIIFGSSEALCVERDFLPKQKPGPHHVASRVVCDGRLYKLKGLGRPVILRELQRK
jgi:hypothetical protein